MYTYLFSTFFWEQEVSVVRDSVEESTAVTWHTSGAHVSSLQNFHDFAKLIYSCTRTRISHAWCLKAHHCKRATWFFRFLFAFYFYDSKQHLLRVQISPMAYTCKSIDLATWATQCMECTAPRHLERHAKTSNNRSKEEPCLVRRPKKDFFWWISNGGNFIQGQVYAYKHQVIRLHQPETVLAVCNVAARPMICMEISSRVEMSWYIFYELSLFIHNRVWSNQRFFSSTRQLLVFLLLSGRSNNVHTSHCGKSVEFCFESAKW